MLTRKTKKNEINLTIPDNKTGFTRFLFYCFIAGSFFLFPESFFSGYSLIIRDKTIIIIYEIHSEM